MAQWQKLLRLDLALQGRVSQLYDRRRFPREIRHCLCALIESLDWDLAAVDENKASSCFHALLVCLEEQWNRSIQENNILQGPDFTGMKDYLLNNFQEKPLNLAEILLECLEEERNILASASGAQRCSSPTLEESWRKLDNKVNELKRQTLEVKKGIKSLENLNEQLDFIQRTWQSQVEQHVRLAPSQAAVEMECRKQANFIAQTEQVVLQQIVDTLKLAEQVVVTLTDVELPEWKRRQQLACIGSPADICLDNLQKWFTAAAEVLLQVNEQMQKLQDQNKKYSSTGASGLPGPAAEIEKLALSLLTRLLPNALVVEKQPTMSSLPHRPLILKTGVRFMVTVRFLANLPELQKYLSKVTPVFDKDVEETKTVKGFRLFDFNTQHYKMLDVNTSGALVADFGHMSLKEKKARVKGSHESHLVVTEELHIIKFVTEFQRAGLKCNIEATSLPVVVFSSSSQIPSAWASVMWWNMLSTGEPRNLSLFADPPPLTWQQLSQVLSWQFLSVGQRELDEDQLSMLRDKIVDDPDGLVHWSKFSKNESVWVWIDGILDLIKKHLVDLWRDGYIMGFVSRERTGALLQEKPIGTFLLRFSESNKDGAITFSWVGCANGEIHVHAVEPYTKRELSANSLPDIIYNYCLTQNHTTSNPLLYLYPDIHKDTVFGHYCNISKKTASKKLTIGYIPARFISVSVNPTPPPSPPGEMEMMDMDISAQQMPFQAQQPWISTPLALPANQPYSPLKEEMEARELLQELFPSLAF